MEVVGGNVWWFAGFSVPQPRRLWASAWVARNLGKSRRPYLVQVFLAIRNQVAIQRNESAAEQPCSA